MEKVGIFSKIKIKIILKLNSKYTQLIYERIFGVMARDMKENGKMIRYTIKVN